jgi:hypothetical protein
MDSCVSRNNNLTVGMMVSTPKCGLLTYPQVDVLRTMAGIGRVNSISQQQITATSMEKYQCVMVSYTGFESLTCQLS